jgi:hypothetical protein
MSHWCSKDLGDGVDALVPTTKIQDAFTPLFVAAGQPKDMAVFSRYDLEKNIVTVYFSPSAHIMARAFGAIQCDKPSSIGIALLIGSQQALFNLFPDRTSKS